MGVPFVYVNPERSFSGTPTTRFQPSPDRLSQSPAPVARQSSASRLAAPRPFRAPPQGAAKLSSPLSSFTNIPTRPSPLVSGFGKPATHLEGKIVKYVPSNTDLFGRATKFEEVHGFAGATQGAHQEWYGSPIEMKNWSQRKGFGESPLYLSRPSHDITVGSLTNTLSMSDSTMRLTEHPLTWRRHRRAASATRLKRSQSQPLSLASSVSSASLCCTFGLHPAFPRSPANLRGSQSSIGNAVEIPGPAGELGSRQTAVSRASLTSASPSRPLWKGNARPFPQDVLKGS